MRQPTLLSKSRVILLLELHISTFIKLAFHLPSAGCRTKAVPTATDRVSRYPLPWTCINFKLDTDIPDRWLVHRWRNAKSSTSLNYLSSLSVMPHLKSFKLPVRFRHLIVPGANPRTKRFNTMEAQNPIRPTKSCRFPSAPLFFI